MSSGLLSRELYRNVSTYDKCFTYIINPELSLLAVAQTLYEFTHAFFSELSDSYLALILSIKNKEFNITEYHLVGVFTR